jgi:hypothetical protein
MWHPSRALEDPMSNEPDTPAFPVDGKEQMFLRRQREGGVVVGGAKRFPCGHLETILSKPDHRLPYGAGSAQLLYCLACRYPEPPIE